MGSGKGCHSSKQTSREKAQRWKMDDLVMLLGVNRGIKDYQEEKSRYGLKGGRSKKVKSGVQ